MTEGLLFTVTDAISWGVAITIICFIGIAFIRRGYRMPDSSERNILLGFGGLTLGIAISRLFIFIRKASVFEAVYRNFAIYYNTSNYSRPFEWELWIIAMVSVLIGFTIFISAFEKILARSKYMLSVLNVAGIIAIFLVPETLAESMMTIMSIFNIILYLIILFYLAQKSRRDFKPVIAIILIGSIIFLAGNALDTTVLVNIMSVPNVVIALITTIGVVVAYSPLLIDPRHFSRALKYWYIASIILVITVPIAVIIISNVELIEGDLHPAISMVAFYSIVIIMVYSIYRMVKVIKEDKVPSKKDQIQDFLKAFVRPKHMSDEEISVSKEKHICLVCKGSISGANYMCPSCGTHYCKRCSDVLAEMENACWSCEAPFDETKSVMQVEKEKGVKDEMDHEKIPAKGKKENLTAHKKKTIIDEEGNGIEKIEEKLK
ncbi:MAG: hypothetical protein ACFFCS_06745 [Candidatus Hodarchaeota archaeon]